MTNKTKCLVEIEGAQAIVGPKTYKKLVTANKDKLEAQAEAIIESCYDSGGFNMSYLMDNIDTLTEIVENSRQLIFSTLSLDVEDRFLEEAFGEEEC